MEPDRWTTCLEQIAELLDADSVGLTVHDHGRRRGSMALMARFDPGLQAEYDAHYSSVNVWKNRGAPRYCAGAVLNSAELCTGPELRRTEWFNDFLRRADAYHSMGAVLERDGSTTSVLTILRAERRGPFEQEEELLRRVSPHFTRAIRTHRMMMGSSAQQEVLEALPVAVFMLDSSLRVRHRNSGGERLLQEGTGVLLRDGQIEAVVSSSQERLDTALSAAMKVFQNRGTEVPSASYFRIDRSGGKGPLQAFATPIRLTRGLLPAAPSILLLLKDPDAVKVDPARLKELFGFTTQEARLAVHLAQGGDLRSAAKQFRITYETARKHLSNLQIKAGVARQVDLVRLILNGIVSTSDPTNGV